MRTLAIVNPGSRAGRTSVLSGRIARLLAPLGSPVELAFTLGPMDAALRTSAALRDGVERIVAVGGDGTVNEVVNGFFSEGAPINPDARLGIVEFGTGGDLRKTLGIPGRPEAAVERIARGATRRIDVGCVWSADRDAQPRRRLFANVASLGLSASTVHRVDGNPRFKRFAGSLAYAAGAAWEVLRYAPRRLQFSFDDAPPVELDIVACAVANARYFGGGMQIAPGAVIDDGWLDLVMVSRAPMLELLGTIPAVFTGSHIGRPCVSYARVRTLTVTCETTDVPTYVETDGESAGQLPGRFEVLPAALTVCV